jgi:hypothetical protein
MSCDTLHERHWYTLFGHPGLRSPLCVRCAHPNPRPLSETEWDELLHHRQRRGRPFGSQLEAAITAENERRRTLARKTRDILAEIDQVNAP